MHAGFSKPPTVCLPAPASRVITCAARCPLPAAAGAGGLCVLTIHIVIIAMCNCACIIALSAWRAAKENGGVHPVGANQNSIIGYIGSAWTFARGHKVTRGNRDRRVTVVRSFSLRLRFMAFWQYYRSAYTAWETDWLRVVSLRSARLVCALGNVILLCPRIQWSIKCTASVNNMFTNMWNNSLWSLVEL